MNGLSCDAVREILPEWKAGALDAMDTRALEMHLAGCSDCREEAAVMEALLVARPEPPQGLEARIQAMLRRELLAQASATENRTARTRDWVLPVFGRPRWSPAWGLSAAAVVVVALGVGLVLKPGGPEAAQDFILVAVQEPLPEAWLWDDGIVAGAPVFDGLSDEDLEALLAEWEEG